MSYEVKWRKVDMPNNLWNSFARPRKFSDIQLAQDFMDSEIENDSGFTRFRIFEGEKPDYKKAYHILMEYWDSLSDEEKPKIDSRLKECGL
jgi:hypothetical protein